MKSFKEKGMEMLQRCEVVVLASINKDGYPRPVPMSKICAENLMRYGWLQGRIH